jgi:alpha-L-rhamnosidase
VTTTAVERLRCEHLNDPRGVDRLRPRLSWQVRSDRRGTTQIAYRLLIARSPQRLIEGGTDVWDSGRVDSPDCVLVPYEGPELGSRQELFWTVRVWDDEGSASDYAPVARWEMGLLAPGDWQAEWIAPATPAGPSGVTYLRRSIHVDGPVRRARAYATALGVYELSCNGQRLGIARFTPGWTDYAQRLQYQVLDLTDLLQPGTNTLEGVLVDGWYAGNIGFLGQRAHYGDTPQLLVQVEVETAAGTVVHATGNDWEAGRGPLLTSDMLMGETRDLAAPLAGWEPVRITAGTPARRVVSPAPSVRVLDERPAAAITRVGADVHRVDFAQNLVGWVRLRLDGEAGRRVTVRHAETLQPDGGLYVANLRTAAATDSYVLDGAGPRVVEPSFTFHGFRYAEVSGYPHDLTPEDVTAVVCGSDLEPVGTFSCSDENVNRLHSNIVWGARGNFLDIPTDCPQRDERMGWTGDAQVFAPTAGYLFDTAAFFTKWLRDLTDAQSPAGSFPDVAPLVVLAPEGSAAWADAGVIVPSVLWEMYGDEELLAELYPAMRRWLEYVHAANPDLLWSNARGYDNGDWLAAHAETDKELIATAYFARSASLTAQAAAMLGRAEAVELATLAQAIAAAFRTAYLLPDGQLRCETQTAYVLALRFGLIPPGLVARAAERLVADIEAHDTHLTTGFLGVGQLLPALTDAGRSDLAYRLLLQDGYPSWLYAVQAGATTIWERWDGWTAEAGYGDPAMNSYNHYALGSVGEWLYRSAAGIGYETPGGRRLRIAPTPDALLDWVRATHVSPYGPVTSGWSRRTDGEIAIDVQVPVGCTATVVLPTAGEAETVQVGSGRHTFVVPSTEGSRYVLAQ